MPAPDDHAAAAGFVIIGSYPVWQGLQLHSLAAAACYRCAECRRARTSAMVALTTDGATVCPGCYAIRLR